MMSKHERGTETERVLECKALIEADEGNLDLFNRESGEKRNESNTTSTHGHCHGGKANSRSSAEREVCGVALASARTSMEETA